MKSLAATAIVLAGCISAPPSPGAMCQQTSDCAGGEVCQEGVCWGDPPSGMYAATLGPPGDRSDLVATELPQLALPQDGWLGDVSLAAPATLAGRVEAYCAPDAMGCDSSSIGATITVTRHSEFPGGPGFHAVITSKDGIARGGSSFTAELPVTGPADPPFTVTVLPDGRGDQPPTSGMSPAMVVPPLRATLATPASTTTTFVLGSAGTLAISGTVSDGVKLLTKYRVVALGQWDPGSPPTEVSTVAYTTDGTFHLLVADGVQGPVQVVARPYDPNAVAPTLIAGNVQPGATQVTVLQPANVGNPVTVTIPVVGVAGNGALAPVSGARVIVTGSYDPMFGGTHAQMSVEGTTGDDGTTQITLLDGTALRASYRVRVIPPAGSSVGVLYDVPLVIDPTAGAAQTLMAQRLPSRVALRGTAVDTAGNPLANLAVTARPSLQFAWTLDPAAQEFLAEIPAATAVTGDAGDFALWVDPFVANVWGHYDLSFEPPATGSPAPSWTAPAIEIPRIQNQTSVTLDPLQIPDAANLHGDLVDPSGQVVSGAELRIYTVTTDTSLCGQVPHPPADCVIPAQLVGHGSSDDHGVVRLTLPRP